MKKILSLTMCTVTLFLLSACSHAQVPHEKNGDETTHSSIAKINKSFKFDQSYQYTIYLNLLGNLGVIQIKNIKNGDINYGKPYIINFKEKGMTIADIINSESSIFASVYDDKKSGGNGKGNKIAVIKQNQLSRFIEFPHNNGMSYMINDSKKEKAYVMTGVHPKKANPKGTPLVSFNTSSEKKLNTLNIKGILGGYAIKGNYIYLAVFGAKKTGYDEVPNQYIAKLKRDTGEISVLTKINNDTSIRDLAERDNNLYLLTSTSNHKGKVDIFNLNGTHLKEINVPSYPFQLKLSEKDNIYVSHIGKNYDGKKVTIIDTKLNKVTKTINGFNGAGEMKIKDQYLFVSNEGESSVSLVDTKTNELLGKVDFGFKSGSSGFVVSKTKNK